MNDKTRSFINDLKKLFKNHNVYLSIIDQYDGMDEFSDQEVSIRSCDLNADEELDINLPIEGLSKALYW